MYNDGHGHNNYTGVKDMWKYDMLNGYPCWDWLYECSVGNATKGTNDLQNVVLTRTKDETTSSWNRKLVTGDSKDYAITNKLGKRVAVVIFAFGTSDEFAHHANRIECHINFFSGEASCF
jgi:hypothetical protein